MSGRQIDSLNYAVSRFSEELKSDDLAAKRVEIAIIAFGNGVSISSNFVSAQEFTPCLLTAGGATPMGEALCQATKLIEERKKILKSNGIPYYRPWLVLMTDGEPTDLKTKFWSDAVAEVKNGVDNSKFTFFPLVTEDGNTQIISNLSPATKILGLNSHRFSEFFLWLANSLQTVSRSRPGDKITLHDPREWIIEI
jgi:uncharacterized protein YegL